jgi:hypothetical protein
LAARSAIPSVAFGLGRRTDRLHAPALVFLCQLPRRRTDLPFEQRGRKSWLFAGSERSADRAAAVATLVMTAKLNDIDPLARLADVLARINSYPARALEDLLPWTWKAARSCLAAAA